MVQWVKYSLFNQLEFNFRTDLKQVRQHRSVTPVLLWHDGRWGQESQLGMQGHE